MFHPFTATMAKSATVSTQIYREAESHQLAEAYLSIAHVYIERACDRGASRTLVYCPYECREEFSSRLEEAGFSVSRAPNIPNRFCVSWEEV